MEKNRILIIEDDLLSAEYLKTFLLNDGYEVLDIIDTAEEAIEKCKTLQPDILLMDIMLKGQLTGSEAAVQINHTHPKCKIIFLTAFSEAEMIDYATQAKAYAYLLKPYREKEILATIQLVLSQNRPQIKREEEIIYLKNGFSFDTKQYRLVKNGKEVPLPLQKLKLAELLAKNKNNTVSNEQICIYIWSEIKSNSTLRSLIYRFRIAIGDDIISNASGVGYSICT